MFLDFGILKAFEAPESIFKILNIVLCDVCTSVQVLLHLYGGQRTILSQSFPPPLHSVGLNESTTPHSVCRLRLCNIHSLLDDTVGGMFRSVWPFWRKYVTHSGL